MKQHLAAALFLLALGAGLRFYALDRHSLWTDEFFTLCTIGAVHAPLAPSEPTPPFYFLLLKPWIAAAGSSPGAIRALSAVWGVVGLVVIWLAAARLIAPRAGLFALALVALSPWHLAYSQEARAYAILFALSAASMWMLAEALRCSRRWWIAYVPITAALLYTHYWGLFVWFAGVSFATHFVFRHPQSAFRTLLPVALAGACFVPHLPTLAAATAAHVQPAFWTPPPALANLGSTLVCFTGTRFYVGGWLFSLGAAVALAVGILAALWTTGLLAESNMRRWLVCYTAAALLLPFAISYALPQMFGAWWRYPMATYPAAIWLAARGWNLWPRSGRAASVAALVLLMTAGDVYYFTGYQKGNVKQAAQLVASQPVTDSVLIVPAYLEPLWRLYYRGPLLTIHEAGMDEMAPELGRFGRAIFVTLDVPNAVKDAMDARYRLIEQRRYPADFHLGLLVAVYRLD